MPNWLGRLSRLPKLVSCFSLFRVARNSPVSETRLITGLIERLRERLPPNWSVAVELEPPDKARPDARLLLTAPDLRTGNIAVEVISPNTAPYKRYVLEIMRRVRAALPDT